MWRVKFGLNMQHDCLSELVSPVANIDCKSILVQSVICHGSADWDYTQVLSSGMPSGLAVGITLI